MVDRIQSALGERAVRLEHIGSTAVPGFAAKPIIDVLLVVPDPADEPACVPDLEAAGYVLVIREPGWFQYQRVKRELAERDWTYVQRYADAKTAVVEEIIARARGRRGAP